MGMYQTTKCGHCKAYWNFLSPYVDSMCGPPIIKCRKCGGLNNTGMKLYRDFTKGEKISFNIGRKIFGMLKAILFIIVGIGMFYGLLLTEHTEYGENTGESNLGYMLSIDNYFGILLFAGFPILMVYFGVNGIKGILDTEEDAKLMEELFDANGGFFWSDWQY